MTIITMNKRQTILVTGSTGQLGQSIQSIRADYLDYEFVFTNRQKIDLSNVSLTKKSFILTTLGSLKSL